MINPQGVKVNLFAGSYESEPKVETQLTEGTGWQQRLIGSFDPTGNSFRIEQFLATDKTPLTREQVLECLIAFNRDAVDPGLLNGLPIVNLPSDTGSARVAYSPSGEVAANINRLLGFGLQAQVKPTGLSRLRNRYNRQGTDTIKLATDLQKLNPAIDRETAAQVMKILVGDLRTQVFMGILDLDSIAHKDPQTWEREIGRLAPVSVITNQERILIQMAREATGIKDMATNYYELLGVAPTADEKELRDAFRKISLENHPDINKHPDAKARMKSMSEAYDVLKDPEKRRAYDQRLAYNAQISPPAGVRDTARGPAGTTTNGQYAERFRKMRGLMSLPLNLVALQSRNGIKHEITGKIYDPNNEADAGELLEIYRGSDPDLYARFSGEPSEIVRQQKATVEAGPVANPQNASAAGGSQQRKPQASPFPSEPPDISKDNPLGRQAEKPIKPRQPNKQPKRKQPKSSGPPVKKEPKLKLERPNVTGFVCYVSKEAWQDPRLGFAQDIGGGKYDHQEDALQAHIQLGPSGSGRRIAISAFDGVGGHAEGELAAKMAAWQLHEDISHVITRERIHGALSSASKRMKNVGNGSATTAAVAYIDENRQLYAYWCGDSRVIVIRGGRAVYSTRDHSWVQEMVASEALTEEEARNHPQRNMITRSLGGHPDDPDKIDEGEPVPLQKGDRVVAVTDGVIDFLHTEGIADIVGKSQSPQQAASSLVEYSRRVPNGDNCTAVVYQVP